MSDSKSGTALPPDVLAKPKRLRHKKCAPGQLRAYWGRESRGDYPDVILAHGGGSTTKRDTTLMYLYLCSMKAGPDLDTFIKELEKRGYDLTTLEFSIKKLP